MAEFSVKLGRRPKRDDPRNLKLATYLTEALAPPPVSSDWTAKVPSWPMFGNDKLGDCTCAAAAHNIEAWTANASGGAANVTDQQVIGAYSAITGYNPATGAPDHGAVELDVLKYWRTTGIAGHQIGAFVEVDPTNQQDVMQGVYLFGGLYVGLNLPLSAQAQIQASQVWDVTTGSDAAPGSWGGHAVPILAYDASSLTVVTWGALHRMTWPFWAAYAEEAYALVSADFLSATGDTPTGLDLQQLNSDLADVSTRPAPSAG